MDRNEHLAWCKERALEYIKIGQPRNALNSMYSDLGKHKETEDHLAIRFGIILQMGGNLITSDQVKKFIEGFN